MKAKRKTSIRIISNEFVLPLEPHEQKDGHSCGLCAMKAIYDFYKLDHSLLAPFLGTHEVALPYDMPMREEIMAKIVERFPRFELSNGTLPHDMMAVLEMDGFTLANTTTTFNPVALKKHIASGHPVLCLSYYLSHWNIISGYKEGTFTFVDSLAGIHDELNASVEEIVCGYFYIKRKAKSRQLNKMSQWDYTRVYTAATHFSLKILAKMGVRYTEQQITKTIYPNRKKATLVGEWINDKFKYKEGTILGNAINNLWG